VRPITTAPLSSARTSAHLWPRG